MNEQQEREAFEAALFDLYEFAPERPSFEHYGRTDTDYVDSRTHKFWLLWKARAALAAAAVPAGLRKAVERTREDLGPTGSNYPDIRLLLAFAEQALAAPPAPAPEAAPAPRLAPDLQAAMGGPWTMELAYQEGFGDAQNFKKYSAAWDLSVTKTKLAPAQAQQAEAYGLLQDLARKSQESMWLAYLEKKAEVEELRDELKALKAQTPQPARVPLTEQQIHTLRAEAKADPRTMDQHWFVLFARAIERAQGITGEGKSNE